MKGKAINEGVLNIRKKGRDIFREGRICCLRIL